MDKIWNSVGFIVICLAIIYGKDFYIKYKSNSEIERVKESVPSYSMEADELYAEYSRNGVAADEKYKNRIVEVTGDVRTISKDIEDNAYVIVGGRSIMDGVHCTFPESENNQVAALKERQNVTIKGVVAGQTGFVLLDKSSLQTNQR